MSQKHVSLFALGIFGMTMMAIGASVVAQEQPTAAPAQPAATATSAEASSSPTSTAEAADPNAAVAVPASQTNATTEAAKPGAPVPSKPAVEVRPYDVELTLAFAESSRLGLDFQRSVLSEVRAIAERSVGPMWNLRIADSSWLTPRHRASIERLTISRLKDRSQAGDFDKIYPVAVEIVGSQYVISGREWCRESELLSPVKSVMTLDRKMVATEVFRLLQSLFRSVAHIDDGTDTTARMKIRAGELWPGDPAFSQVADNSIFVPFTRNYGRDRSLRAIQFVPWTYLAPTTVARSRLDCRVDTGVRVKFAPKKRVEWRALTLKVTLKETELTVQPQRKTAKPLVGYMLAVYDEFPKDPPKKPATEAPIAGPSADGDKKPAVTDTAATDPGPVPLLMRTDRDGHVFVPAKPEKPLQWVFIRSGKELLTKFPMVAGAEAKMTASCPDDTLRLDVEGQIALLEGELVDVIAKRAVTVAMIKARAKKSEWDRVSEGFESLTKQPKLDDFKKSVDLIQVPAMKAAQAKKNVMAEDRIRKLSAKVLEIAQFHLDDEKITELKQEMDETKKAEMEKTDVDLRPPQNFGPNVKP